ncbi:MAG TPA: glycosyltransferase family 2 protein [Acetobacteraceae bacterium]|nr:glycosyltransferase family 2 protein [Acetobacteraceae bacterium]
MNKPSPRITLPLQSGAFALRTCHSSADGPTAVVAIPAKDEEERIGLCILALARQTRPPDAVLLLLNNCSDRTAEVARGLSRRLPYDLYIAKHTFPAPIANAGNARRLAMKYAAGLAGRDGILLTTDADSVVPEDWVANNLAAISAGADLVCGQVQLDAMGAASIPPHLHADAAQERELTRLLDEVGRRLDPEAADPWPRHTEAAGASLAVTVAAFTRAGGIPAIASAEDRAFVSALARMDARIRHDPAITVTVSGRIHGRAPGGMADTIRRRIRQRDEFADQSLEPATDAYRRFDFRRRVRLAWRDLRAGRTLREELAIDIGIPYASFRRMLNNHFFGATWANVESNSPCLVRRRVRFTELPSQIAYVRRLLGQQTDACPVILKQHIRPTHAVNAT